MIAYVLLKSHFKAAVLLSVVTAAYAVAIPLIHSILLRPDTFRKTDDWYRKKWRGKNGWIQRKVIELWLIYGHNFNFINMFALSTQNRPSSARTAFKWTIITNKIWGFEYLLHLRTQYQPVQCIGWNEYAIRRMNSKSTKRAREKNKLKISVIRVSVK